MKKLLLSLGCMVGLVSAASAAEYVISTVDMTGFTQTTYTYDGKEKGQITGTWTAEDGTAFNVVMKQQASGTAPDGILGQNNQCRWYKDFEMTITAPESVGAMTKIVFTVANSKHAAFTVEGNKGTVTDNTSDITWTYADGMNPFVATANKAQIRFNKVVISTGEGGGGEDPQPPVTLETTKVANIGAWLVSADPSELYEFENPVTVVYQNGLNTYVQDETGSMFIYGSIPTYTPGQQIPAGFVGNYKDYYSTIELVIPNDDTKDACVATYKEGVAGTMPEPAEVAISAIDGETMGNKYVKLAGVTVSALDGKNFTITQGEATIAGFNKFGVEVADTEEGKTVDVIGLVNWYTAKGATEPTASIYPIEIVAQGGTPVDPDPDKTIILSTDFDANDGFTFEDGTLPEGLTYVWTRDKNYNYMKASCFKSGNHAVEGAFLVSPVLDLTNRNEITLTFNQALGFCTAEQAAEMLSLWVREENMDWSVELPIQAWPAAVEGKNFTAFESAGEYDLDQFKNKKIQLGWKYTSTTEVGPTWEIDAVKVTGKIDNAISNIEADVNAPVEYFNLQGVRVANPENGLYIMRQGNKVTKVIR